MLEHQQCLREQSFLASHLVVIGSVCGFHLCDVGFSLRTHFHHYLRLVEEHHTFLSFLIGKGECRLIIECIDICLQHMLCYLVLLGSKSLPSHQQIRLGSTQVVVALQSIEERNGCLHTITIIKCVDIRIGVGFRVDSTSEIKLPSHTCLHRRKECTYSTLLVGSVIIQLYLLESHLMIVSDSILYAIIHRPCLLLPIHRQRGAHQEKYDKNAGHVLSSFCFADTKLRHLS